MGDEQAERRAQLLRSVADTVVGADGDLEPDVRAAILGTGRAQAGDGGDGGAGVAPPLAAFVDKVIERAYTVTDADIDGLRAAGLSEDAIFEAVVAAAVGAGLARLDAGMAALAGKE